MADNYLEKKYEEYLARKAAAEKARRLAWKKRMDAYRKKLADESSVNQAGTGTGQTMSRTDRTNACTDRTNACTTKAGPVISGPTSQEEMTAKTK